MNGLEAAARMMTPRQLAEADQSDAIGREQIGSLPCDVLILLMGRLRGSLPPAIGEAEWTVVSTLALHSLLQMIVAERRKLDLE